MKDLVVKISDLSLLPQQDGNSLMATATIAIGDLVFPGCEICHDTPGAPEVLPLQTVSCGGKAVALLSWSPEAQEAINEAVKDALAHAEDDLDGKKAA